MTEEGRVNEEAQVDEEGNPTVKIQFYSNSDLFLGGK